MEYEIIDSILHLLVDRKMKPKTVAKELKIPASQVDKIMDMMQRSSHKRDTPPIARIN
jgi:NAD+ synthase